MNFNFDDNIILQNEFVLIKPVISADAVNLLPIALSNSLLLQYSPKQIYSKELLEEYIENAILERRLNTRYTFSIFSKKSCCYIGSTAFMNVSNVDLKLEIGATWMGKQFQSTGINKECKFLMLQYAFDVLNAHRVEFRTDERNTQSRRALEKIGAKQEGILRESMLMYDGFKRSSVYYSILSSEWEILKANFSKL